MAGALTCAFATCLNGNRTVRHLSVIVSTAYLDEAERCAQVYLLRDGRLLASGTPADLRKGAENLVYLAQAPSEPLTPLYLRRPDAVEPGARKVVS